MEEFVLIMRHEDGKKARFTGTNANLDETNHGLDRGHRSPKQICLQGTGLPFEDARVVRPNNVVTNGPFGEIKETIGGYIIVKADSVDEAVEFAKGCPVLQGEGNSMEVRKIAKGDGLH